MIRTVFDADVLYALPLRDTLLSAADEGCFMPLWSDKILDEAIGNLLVDRRLTPARAIVLRNTLDTYFANALVEDYRPLIPAMRNHPKDRHVAACAAAAEATHIVTGNIKDFKHLPDGIAAIHPDDFLCALLTGMPEQLRAAQSARLTNPPIDAGTIVIRLAGITPKFATAWQGGAT